jgi:hypothetical protein
MARETSSFKKHVGVFVVAVVAVLSAGVTPVHAILLDWQATSGLKPDEIGTPFTLVDTSAANDPALSLGVLTLDTDADSELMTYTQAGATLDMSATPVIEFNMRMVSQSSIDFPLLRTGAAVGITTLGNAGTALYIGIDEVFFLTNGGLHGDDNNTIDTDGSFYDYRIEIDGLTAGSAVRLYQDNVEVLSDVLFNDSGNHGSGARIYFGNNTSVAHGTSEWTSFEHNALAVPEPGTCVLAILGLLTLGAMRRRRQR